MVLVYISLITGRHTTCASNSANQVCHASYYKHRALCQVTMPRHASQPEGRQSKDFWHRNQDSHHSHDDQHHSQECQHHSIEVHQVHLLEYHFRVVTIVQSVDQSKFTQTQRTLYRSIGHKSWCDSSSELKHISFMQTTTVTMV